MGLLFYKNVTYYYTVSKCYYAIIQWYNNLQMSSMFGSTPKQKYYNWKAIEVKSNYTFIWKRDWHKETIFHI